MAIVDEQQTSATPRQIDGIANLREQAAALAATARREALIISSDLQAPLYDQEPFLLELRRLAISSRRAKIQILVRDIDPIIKRGHRLLELAARLPSFIEIRRLAPEDSQYEQCFLLVDRAAYLWQQSSGSRLGELSYDAGVRGRQLAAEFLELWERGAPDPNLRRLAL